MSAKIQLRSQKLAHQRRCSSRRPVQFHAAGRLHELVQLLDPRLRCGGLCGEHVDRRLLPLALLGRTQRLAVRGDQPFAGDASAEGAVEQRVGEAIDQIAEVLTWSVIG